MSLNPHNTADSILLLPTATALVVGAGTGLAVLIMGVWRAGDERSGLGGPGASEDTGRERAVRWRFGLVAGLLRCHCFTQ